MLLEPDGITLDRSLVAEAARDRSQRHALERFVRVASALGADVTVDGLSSALQRDVAKASGVRFGQGPLVGRRRPVAA